MRVAPFRWFFLDSHSRIGHKSAFSPKRSRCQWVFKASQEFAPFDYRISLLRFDQTFSQRESPPFCFLPPTAHSGWLLPIQKKSDKFPMAYLTYHSPSTVHSLARRPLSNRAMEAHKLITQYLPTQNLQRAAITNDENGVNRQRTDPLPFSSPFATETAQWLRNATSRGKQWIEQGNGSISDRLSFNFGIHSFWSNSMLSR